MVMNTLSNGRAANRGFTIVELLIVIVVIAILASITVVAYNGISDRSQASRKLTIASQYARLLEMYKVDNGKYPDSISDSYPSGGETCLGTAQDYPAKDGYNAGDCLHSADNTYLVGDSSALRTALSKYGSLPSASYPTTMNGTESWRGFRYVYFGPSNGEARVEWIYKGTDTSQCGRAIPSTTGVGTVWCVLRLSPSGP